MADKADDPSDVMPPAVDAGWLVVNTHAHRELLAVDNLVRQNFDVYCPQVLKRLRRGTRYFDAARPLFPGYVFVASPPPGAPWRPILSTLGVRRLIQFAGHPARLDGGFVAALKAREHDGIVRERSDAIKPGDRVALAGGPFDGVLATVLSVSEKDRLVILLDLLSRPVKVTIDGRNVGRLVDA